MSPQLLGLDVAENSTQRAAVDRRRDHARDRLQVVPQVLVGDVVEFRVVHVGIRYRDQAQRYAGRRVEWHHHRRDRSRRQVEHVAHRVHAHLAQCLRLADLGVEEVLDDADSLQRLGLLVLDPGTLTRPPLQPTHDVLLHHLRRHSGVETDDLGRRGGERRQEVRRDPRQADHADDRDDQHVHDHQVGVFQSSSDHPVASASGWRRALMTNPGRTGDPHRARLGDCY